MKKLLLFLVLIVPIFTFPGTQVFVGIDEYHRINNSDTIEIKFSVFEHVDSSKGEFLFSDTKQLVLTPSHDNHILEMINDQVSALIGFFFVMIFVYIIFK